MDTKGTEWSVDIRGVHIIEVELIITKIKLGLFWAGQVHCL